MRLSCTMIAAVVACLALALVGARADDPPQERPDAPATAHAEPRWLKGNLHTHSLWSDGNDYPEMIVDWYARHGYQFLALSDHNVLGQGQKWLGVQEADERAKHDGFARYRRRLGAARGGTPPEDGVEEGRVHP